MLIHVSESCKFYFIFLISGGNVINIKISTTKLPLRHVSPIFFKAIYVPLSEYHRGICSARMVPISQSAHRLKFWIEINVHISNKLNFSDFYRYKLHWADSITSMNIRKIKFIP